MARREIRTLEWQGRYYWPRGNFVARSGDLIYGFAHSVARACGLLCAILLILIIGLCIYILADAQIVVRSADLPEEIVKLAPSQEKVDFSALKVVNDDIVGWIVVDGTGIDYPVLRGKDNDYYLSRNYLKQWAASGSVFMDYRNKASLEDDFTIIYGHRMGYGKMFSDVTLFADGEFFAEHTTGTYYYDGGKYSLRSVAFALITATEQDVYDAAYSKNGDVAVRLIYDQAIWRNGILTDGRYVLLSTCDAQDRSKRDVLLMRAQ